MSEHTLCRAGAKSFSYMLHVQSPTLTNVLLASCIDPSRVFGRRPMQRSIYNIHNIIMCVYIMYVCMYADVARVYNSIL